ncbi:MAG TPA: methyl-accepting chemotaxis protein [Myxococcales bacterium]|nr:methyl-accepting chemotaxis protein [Myxococcales bacterium]
MDLPLFCSRPAVDSTSTDTTVKIVFRASGKADLTSRTTLATRLAVGAALVALIPLIALALTFMVLAERAMRKQVDAALLAKAQSFAVLIQSSILDPLSHENALRAWVADRRVATAFGAPRARDACSQFLAAAIRGRMVLGAELLDLSGRPVCASSPELASAADAGAPWFRAAADGSFASEGIVSASRGLALSVAVRAADRAGATRGVLRAWYDWSTIAQLMIDPLLAQARLADEEVQLQVSSARTVLYDSAGSAGTPLDAGSGAKGTAEQGKLFIGWARNDTAATDPGGGFAYVSRISRAAAFASSRGLLRVIAMAGVIATLGAAIAAWLLSRTLVRPLNRLGDAVERIVQEGDLTQQIEVSSDDEIGRLAGAFAALVEKLREVPRRLRESAEALSAQVERLDRAAREQNERVARQAAALQETQVTAQEIRQTSLMAADKANAVLGAAHRADEVGRSGEDALAQSLNELEQILSHVDAISRTMGELGESTSRIAGITGLVKDLADQSNMLALNAAIEAVRSGEHGRGFAVVAREIRSLADQSIKATQRVQENVEAIRANAARAVGITEQGSRGIAANLTRVRGSGDSLRELGTIARSTAHAVREIAAAVGQQNAGIDHVFIAVRDLSASMTDLVSLIEQSAQSVRELGGVSARIGGIVNQFRV